MDIESEQIRISEYRISTVKLRFIYHIKSPMCSELLSNDTFFSENQNFQMRWVVIRDILLIMCRSVIFVNEQPVAGGSQFYFLW